MAGEGGRLEGKGAKDMNVPELHVTCFRLGGDMYAVDIMRVKEIIRPQRLASLPKAPPFVEGVINLRGTVIPVIDLRRRFDLPLPEGERSDKLLIVSVAGRLVGLVVDEVTGIETVPVKEIKPPPDLVRGVGSEYLIGVCLAKDALIMLLNLDRILSPDEAASLERAGEPG